MVRALPAKRSIRRALLALLALVLAGVLLALWSGPAEAATTFTVNRTGDASDRNLNNSVCDVSRERGKQCTLRAAIQEANDTLGADTINFRIGSTSSVKTISPGSPLPDITEAVTIDGYTQRGASENTLAEGNDAVLKVQLNGTNAGADANGLTIEASDSTIRGLVINRFDGVGVELGGKGGNKIEGNFIGTRADGTGDLGNSSDGVEISAPTNTIGGTAAGARNVISGNNQHGVLISGTGATGNNVQGNFLGTTADGTVDLGNTRSGVSLSEADDNTVGGTAAGARNVISGNNENGIAIFGDSSGNKVQGNRIGTKADGSGDLGNGNDGVSIITTNDNTVGGTESGAGNAISGNDRHGVSIFGGLSTGNDVKGNGIRANDQDGVNVTQGSDNTIGGNRILANGDNGVEVSSGGKGNSILSNPIFQNVGLGIDLVGGTENGFGVTANDNNDPDTGANNRQNFPVITSVAQSSSFLNPTTIRGTLNSTPNQDFTVQCFLASEIPEDADDSGHGEGQAFMAEDTDVRTDANGDADGNDSFECNFLFPVSLEGKRWSATATNEATGDTSEFSANFPVE